MENARHPNRVAHLCPPENTFPRRQHHRTLPFCPRSLSAKLQLVGITCMFIAAKTEEFVSPAVANFLNVADLSYIENEILQAEHYVLQTLEWNLSYPNAIHFLRRISKADEYDMQVRTIAKYILEIGIVEWGLLAAPPSLMVAAAIWLGRLILDRDVWTPNLVHYSGYAESSLLPRANFMLNYSSTV